MKQISQEIQDKFDESGMHAVESLVDSLEELLEQLKSGPVGLVKKAEQQVDEFKGSVAQIVEDPSAVASGAGLAAACATSYAKSVAKGLGVVASESDAFAARMSALAGDVAEPLGQVSRTLEKALSEMESSVKALAKLPKLIEKEIAGKDSPEDVAKVDTAPMKSALAGGDVEQPLAEIAGLVETLKGVVDVVNSGVGALQDFVGTEPGHIQAAFQPPFPLCCLSSAVPAALTELLAKIEQLSKIDLDPIVEALRNASGQIGSIDVEAIKTPMATFKGSATDLVDKLDKTVVAAKLSSGGVPTKVGDLFH